MEPYRCLIVADDLTGATDTGNEFAKRGHPTVVALGTESVIYSDDIGDAPVVVVTTESRYSPGEEAKAAVERAVEASEADVVYKKIDSTLRGNVAAEIEGAMDATTADVGLVAPAFPTNDRATICGYHLVDGKLVTETPAGRDPDKPVTDSHVPTLLSDLDYTVEHVPIDRVARGNKSVSEALREVAITGDSPTVVVCDAAHDDHLGALAEGAAMSGLDILYVGSAGLARHVHLSRTDGQATTTADNGESIGENRTGTANGYALGIVGSTNPKTLTQLCEVTDSRRVLLDPETAVHNPERAGTEAAERLQSAVADGSFGVVASAEEQAHIEAALSAGASAGIGESEIRKRVATALSMAATEAWTSDGLTPTGLFLTGGSIAIEVLTRLSASGIRLSGTFVETGVPLGSVLGGTAAETPVITKAGAFGGKGTIVNCLDSLAGLDGPV